jgi:hypothetical protein
MMQSVLAAPHTSPSLAARGQHKIARRCFSFSLSKTAIARARSVTCHGDVELRQIAV